LNLSIANDLGEFLEWHRCVVSWGLTTYVKNCVQDLEEVKGTPRRQSFLALFAPRSAKDITKPRKEEGAEAEAEEDEELEDEETEDGETETAYDGAGSGYASPSNRPLLQAPHLPVNLQDLFKSAKGFVEMYQRMAKPGRGEQAEVEEVEGFEPMVEERDEQVEGEEAGGLEPIPEEEWNEDEEAEGFQQVAKDKRGGQEKVEEVRYTSSSRSASLTNPSVSAGTASSSKLPLSRLAVREKSPAPGASTASSSKRPLPRSTAPKHTNPRVSVSTTSFGKPVTRSSASSLASTTNLRRSAKTASSGKPATIRDSRVNEDIKSLTLRPRGKGMQR
jgi:hypothetical protein